MWKPYVGQFEASLKPPSCLREHLCSFLLRQPRNAQSVNPHLKSLPGNGECRLNRCNWESEEDRARIRCQEMPKAALHSKSEDCYTFHAECFLRGDLNRLCVYKLARMTPSLSLSLSLILFSFCSLTLSLSLSFSLSLSAPSLSLSVTGTLEPRKLVSESRAQWLAESVASLNRAAVCGAFVEPAHSQTLPPRTTVAMTSP